jgi:SAM-dependent methyltransferase
LGQDDEPINHDVLARIPLTARAVLEVGCGSAALGAEYKRRNPNCLYVGLENDPARAEAARARLDQVFEGDLDIDPLPCGIRSFDCIVYDDGLEHLRDPWSVLRTHVALLAPGGTLVLCVPNVEHWSIAASLLRGEWDYAERGLLDVRHLRWFSRRTAERALTDAGLEVTACIPRVFDVGQAQEFVQSMAAALPALRIEPQALMNRVAPLQYLFVATRGAPDRMTLYSTMLRPVGGVSHVRVIEPIEALLTVPGVTASITAGIPPGQPGTEPRIFVFHRPAFLDAEGLVPVRQALAQGYLVVCEFDDNPDFIPILQQGEVQNFKAVHAVQTSTEPLAELLRAQNPEVAVFPNGLRRLPDVRNYGEGPLTLFFAGLNRTDDWPPYLDALNDVATLAGDRLRFRIVGDRGLFDALRTPHKSFTPICDYETYQDLLGGSEISFMPLRDNPFNACKSDLKFIEAGAHRVTALASPVAYAHSVEDGRTGVIFRDAQELRQRLTRLIANPDIGRGIGDAARLYVARERMNAYQVSARLAWYHDLWLRKPELDAKLALRCPALFNPPTSPLRAMHEPPRS